MQYLDKLKVDLIEILEVYRIRQYNPTCVQNPLPWQLKREQWPLLKRQMPIVYTNALTIFQLETIKFISWVIIDIL